MKADDFTTSDLRRFDERVKKGDPGECWPWTGTKTPRGYGRVWIRGIQFYAHRLALMLALGELGSDKHALHRCDNPSCVNPDHLFAGSHSENMRDMMRKGRGGTSILTSERTRGRRNPKAKLTPEQVREIRLRADRGEMHTKIAVDYGVTANNIGWIASRKTWRHIK